MPFGLRNAAQLFQRFIDQVLRGLTCSYACIDDILVASNNAAEHLEHLHQVFSRLQHHGLQINPPKCVHGAISLEFLRHHVDKDGIRPLETKVQAIKDYPQPTSQCELHQFLGLINFYYRFVPECARILQPRNNLLAAVTKRNANLPWTEHHTSAFRTIKEALANASLLHHPHPDAPTCIATDASDVTVGAVLQQHIGSHWCALAYFFRKLTATERKYSTFD